MGQANDAIKRVLIELWTATSHTTEQDENKDKQLALYYQNLRKGNWTLRAVGKAFDNLSRESKFWPAWAEVEKELNLVQTDMAPRQIRSDPPHLVKRRMADQAMMTPTGQIALTEGWGRSYHVSIERDGRSPNLTDADFLRFRKGRDEFREMFENLDMAIPGNDMAKKIGQAMIDGEANLRERFLEKTRYA